MTLRSWRMLDELPPLQPHFVLRQSGQIHSGVVGQENQGESRCVARVCTHASFIEVVNMDKLMWRENGLCVKCGSLRQDERYLMCVSCRIKTAMKGKVFRVRREQLYHEAKLCVACGKSPPLEKHKRCASCIADGDMRIIRLHARRLAAGLCTRCGKNPFSVGRTVCESCLSRGRANAKRSGKNRYKNTKLLARENSKRCYHRLRDEAFDRYGRACVCCGFRENTRFLTFDHVNNDGHAQRRRWGRSTDAILRAARSQNWPSDIQVLCWNCNMAKAHNNGICPHREMVNDEVPEEEPFCAVT